MAASSSIAQEFYKVRNEWEKIDRNTAWRLAIWVAQYQDVDLIDKFIETERLAIGVFEDIFFRFDTEYKGKAEEFEYALWEEYKEWFNPSPVPQKDMYTALKNDGLLLQDYTPNLTLPHTFANLILEMLRFKSCIEGLEHRNFCIYFPPTSPDGVKPGAWFTKVLKECVPKGIRMITIDFAAKRKVAVSGKIGAPEVVEIHPNLNTLEAINNEMDKAGSTYDTVSIDAQFRKQIRIVMNNTVKKSTTITDKDVQTLLSLSKQSSSTSGFISGLLVASQAYFSIAENEKSEYYASQAIQKAGDAMSKEDPAGYPIWKSCMMLKGALLMGKKKYKEAIEIYELLASTASTKGDAYFAMEGYRLSGHLYYEQKKMEVAFQTLLLALVAGSYLDEAVRRQSTFLHAAYLALYVGEKTKSNHELKILEEQLADWLGADWRSLLMDEGVTNAKTKQKTSFLEFI